MKRFAPCSPDVQLRRATSYQRKRTLGLNVKRTSVMAQNREDSDLELHSEGGLKSTAVLLHQRHVMI